MGVVELADVVGQTARGVVLAVLPLAVLFAIFQLLFLRLPQREVARVVTGAVVASVGLFIFLVGVEIALLPFGRAIGEALGTLSSPWLLIPFGLVLGFVTTWGEPAVRVLADQVEDASTGSIQRRLVLFAIALGVAVAVAVGLLRIVYEIPLVWLLVPGYAMVIVLMRLSDQGFVSIAVDAGGVATGPLANTFLLALALGTSSAIAGRNPLVHGLGLVALIALAPMLSVMLLGLLVRLKAPKES